MVKLTIYNPSTNKQYPKHLIQTQSTTIEIQPNTLHMQIRGVYSGKSDCLVLPKNKSFYGKPAKMSCVWTEKLPKTHEGTELAQNRGQIWTQHA